MERRQWISQSFRGCVAVYRGEEVLWTASQGWADWANRRPNALDTRFPTASAGKAFVAVGVLQLIEQGRLALDSTLGGLLELGGGIDPDITVHQLLNHTSGIPDYFDESVMADYDELWRDYPNYKIRRSCDLIPLFIEKPMLYAPGQRFQYNNTGYVVLGLIIERLTGLSFDEYLAQRVFRPSGMSATGYFELDRLPGGCANAYIYDAARADYHTNIYSVDVKGTGAGGAFTTLPDVNRFWRALYGGRLLSSGSLAEMTSVQAEGEGALYGYGLWLDRRPDGRITPHFEGCDPGVSFISSYDPAGERCVVLASNYQDDVWTPWSALMEHGAAL